MLDVPPAPLASVAQPVFPPERPVIFPPGAPGPGPLPPVLVIPPGAGAPPCPDEPTPDRPDCPNPPPEPPPEASEPGTVFILLLGATALWLGAAFALRRRAKHQYKE